ncbi:MAG: aquaporin family protein [Betaproteobacteria bacterium]|nr:aquaporin family protein [Betaproteobacteria bacterium]
MRHWRLCLAEMVGTAALLCAVIGSGIMAERLSGGHNGVALLANTLATVFALYVLIETIGPISGAHFNPAVTLVMAFRKNLPRHLLLGYVCAQLLGAALGAWLAHAMFELPILQWSAKVRTGNGQWLAEAVATAGLLFVILRVGGGIHRLDTPCCFKPPITFVTGHAMTTTGLNSTSCSRVVYSTALICFRTECI